MSQVQVRDTFKALPSYCVDPLTMVAIGLKLGMDKFEKAKRMAKERGVGEFAVIGDCGVHVSLNPPLDSRPPEPWMHEFVKTKWLAQAREIVAS